MNSRLSLSAFIFSDSPHMDTLDMTLKWDFVSNSAITCSKPPPSVLNLQIEPTATKTDQRANADMAEVSEQVRL